MSSSDVDKTLKEKEPKTPPVATSQVFVVSFLFCFVFDGIDDWVLYVWCQQHPVALSRSSLQRQLVLRQLIPNGLIIRFLVKNSLESYVFLLMPSLDFDPQLFHSTGIFSYTSAWIHGIKSPRPPIYVGCSGNCHIHNYWSISVSEFWSDFLNI